MSEDTETLEQHFKSGKEIHLIAKVQGMGHRRGINKYNKDTILTHVVNIETGEEIFKHTWFPFPIFNIHGLITFTANVREYNHKINDNEQRYGLSSIRNISYLKKLKFNHLTYKTEEFLMLLHKNKDRYLVVRLVAFNKFGSFIYILNTNIHSKGQVKGGKTLDGYIKNPNGRAYIEDSYGKNKMIFFNDLDNANEVVKELRGKVSNNFVVMQYAETSGSYVWIRHDKNFLEHSLSGTRYYGDADVLINYLPKLDVNPLTHMIYQRYYD